MEHGRAWGRAGSNTGDRIRTRPSSFHYEVCPMDHAALECDLDRWVGANICRAQQYQGCSWTSSRLDRQPCYDYDHADCSAHCSNTRSLVLLRPVLSGSASLCDLPVAQG